MTTFDAAIFAGGPTGDRPTELVAADGGLHLARALGVLPDVVIGDMDSVDPETLAAAVDAGVSIVQHPRDKDHTDLELALDHVAAAGHRSVLVVGSDGGRLDHLLGSVSLLAAERFARLELEAILGDQRVVVVRGHRALSGVQGGLVSLLAWHGPAHGVSTTGLRWPLIDESLEAGTSLGISNEFTSTHATVDVRLGCVVAVIPPPLLEAP